MKINPEQFRPPAPDEVMGDASNAMSDISDTVAAILENNPITMLARGMRRFNSDMRRRF